MPQTGHITSYNSSSKSKNLTYLMEYIYHTICIHHYNSLFDIKFVNLFYFSKKQKHFREDNHMTDTN